MLPLPERSRERWQEGRERAGRDSGGGKSSRPWCSVLGVHQLQDLACCPFLCAGMLAWAPSSCWAMIYPHSDAGGPFSEHPFPHNATLEWQRAVQKDGWLLQDRKKTLSMFSTAISTSHSDSLKTRLIASPFLLLSAFTGTLLLSSIGHWWKA